MKLEDILIDDVTESEADDQYFDLSKKFGKILNLSYEDAEYFLEGQFFQSLYDALVSEAKLKTEKELVPFSEHFVVATYGVWIRHQPHYRMLSDPSSEDDWEYLESLPSMLYKSVNEGLRNLIPDLVVAAQTVKSMAIIPRLDAIWE